MIGGWITGVDVSRHQRPDACDWARAKEAGLDFAVVKLSEGQDYRDPAADEHLRRLRAAGVRTGAYHFARPDNRFRETSDGRAAGEREATWMLESLHACRAPISLPPAIDLERYTERGRVTSEQRGDFVRAMVGEILRYWGRAPTIYTGDEYWRFQMPAELAGELRAMGCALWLVSYTAREEPGETETIRGWPWALWQWSGGGKYSIAPQIDGLPHPIDVNRYRGSVAELSGWGGASSAWFTSVFCAGLNVAFQRKLKQRCLPPAGGEDT